MKEQEESYKKIFRSKAVKVSSLYSIESGKMSFKIPVYQREYDWSEDNIHRIFEDVLSGLYSLSVEEDPLTFIGTFILVTEDVSKEEFSGRSIIVVDGQQRLTTLTLIACELFSEIGRQLRSLEELRKGADENVVNWLISEAKYTQSRLLGLAFDEFTSDKKNYYPVPRIVRHGDSRSLTRSASTYNSAIAAYLDDFSTQYTVDRSLFESESAQRNEKVLIDERFTNNLSSIVERVLVVSSGAQNGKFELLLPDISEFKRSKFRRLWNELPVQTRTRNQTISKACGLYSSLSSPLMRLIGFATYMLDFVIATQVVVEDEKYAFDIFDSLNTTGEPLTAIQTFKPLVVQTEIKYGPYERSDSCASFGIVEKYLRRFSGSDAHQREAKELVVAFALYYNGEKRSLQLSDQRRFLRGCYNDLDKYGIEKKRMFIQHLSEIAAYKSHCWHEKDIAERFQQSSERSVVLVCLSLLSRMKMTLTIPVLCRYYFEAHRKSNWKLFFQAVKALTAFVILRRSVSVNTANIDGDLRGLMSRGRPSLNKGDSRPLCLGMLMNNALLDIKDLQSLLIEWLKKSEADISSRENWVDQVALQPLYKVSKPLCRFLLLASAHNARLDPDSSMAMVKRKPSSELQFLCYDRWSGKEFETVEHVAPNRTGINGWHESIYDKPYIKDSLGNLSLLPKLGNAAVGNADWEKKKLFYQAFSAEDDTEVENLIQTARSEGRRFSKRSEEILREGTHLPIIRYIASVDEWNADVIESRSRNIASLAWDEVRPWLGK